MPLIYISLEKKKLQILFKVMEKNYESLKILKFKF